MAEAAMIGHGSSSLQEKQGNNGVPGRRPELLKAYIARQAMLQFLSCPGTAFHKRELA